MSLISKALRGKRVPVAWALLLLGMAGLNAIVLLHGEAGLSDSHTAGSSHAPPPAQINTRLGAAMAGDDRLPNRDSLLGQRLALSTTRLHLGDGKPNEIKRGELTLTNPNSSPVAFSFIKHCGCTELSPMSGTLPARGSETIHVGIQLPDHANSEKNTSIELRAGGSPEIVGRCVVSASCPAPFRVTPAFVSFGTVTTEQLTASSHHLNLESVEGQPPLNPDRLAIEHHAGVFRVARATSLSAADSRAMLRVSIEPGLSQGDHWDSLSIRLTGSEYVLRIPMSVSVADPITVIPGTVYLRAATGAGVPKPMGLVVVDNRLNSRQLGKVSLVAGPPGANVDDLGASAAGRRRLNVSLETPPNAWPDESEVWLTADGLKFSFKIVKRK